MARASKPSVRLVETVEAELASAARDGLSWDDFGRAAIDLIGRVIPHEAICLATADPMTGLFTGTVKGGIDDSADDRFVRLEYGVADVNQFRDLARRRVGIGVLHQATDGDSCRSVRYRELLKPHYGLEHEMRSVARLHGQVWGTCALYRSASSPGFSPNEASALARLEEGLAIGMRRSLVSPANPHGSMDVHGPAVLVLNGEGELTHATGASEKRVAQLGGDLWRRLPAPIAAVVEALRSSDPAADGPDAQLHTRTPSGEWLTVKAASLDGPGTGSEETVVTIERAKSTDTMGIVIRAYGLTAREGDVVRGVVSGASTSEIAADLGIAAYTVQDHLKAVFHKLGVASRSELSALLNGHRAVELL